MNRFNLIILISILLLCFGCSDSTDQSTNPPISEGGEIPLQMSLRDAMQHGYQITRVRATITRDTYINSLNLTLTDSMAYGTFTDLEEGTYTISIEAYEDDLLIATGSGMAEVIAGQTSQVEITLTFIDYTGELEITVVWNENYDPPQRVLFVGNSYTDANLGLDYHLRNLVLSADSTQIIETSRVAPGGYTLEAHWHDQNTITTIENGNWDVVILQEQSMRPVTDPDLMYEYATLLNGAIIRSFAQTGFFMTWAREFDPPMIEDLSAAYNHISAELDAMVAPVGRAFQLMQEEHPDIDIYHTDGSHPSPHGTYLAACVFYVVLWHDNPVGIEYGENEYITEEEKLILQEMAWETVCIYGGWF